MFCFSSVISIGFSWVVSLHLLLEAVPSTSFSSLYIQPEEGQKGSKAQVNL